MKIEMDTYMTLSDIAKEMGWNKSKLNYYAKLGIIVPVLKLGFRKWGVFHLEDSIMRLKKAKELRKKGMLLEDVAKEFKKYDSRNTGKI